MQKEIRVISIILLIISLILFPFLGIGILFGLAGSTAKYFYLIGISYLTLIVSLIISIFRYKFFPIAIISIFLIIIGFHLDSSFWENHNNNLCEELRAEPSCVEDVCGFRCDSFGEHDIGFVTSGSVCEDKDMTLCQKKLEHDLEERNQEKDILEYYSELVDQIIINPSNDYENELVAIYNCLEEKHGYGFKGTQLTTQVLKDKVLTEEELNIYYDYMGKNGRNVNRDIITSALPAGDKKYSCDFIN